MPLLRHPPPLDQLCNSPEIVYFSRNAVSAAATSNMVRAPCMSRFGVVGSSRVETTGARQHKLLGSDPIDFSRETQNQSQETGQEKGSRKMKKAVWIAAVALAAWAKFAVAGDIAAGEKVFKKCTACHSIGEKGKNMVGPVQNGLKGRKSGTVPGYNYTEANKNSGIVWDEATFKEYIKDPQAKIPGTKMVFQGIKDVKDAEDLWSFLEQFGLDGKKK